MEELDRLLKASAKDYEESKRSIDVIYSTLQKNADQLSAALANSHERESQLLKTNRKQKTQIARLESQLEVLTPSDGDLQRRCVALDEAVKLLSAKRIQDKQTIKVWQDQLAELEGVIQKQELELARYRAVEKTPVKVRAETNRFTEPASSQAMTATTMDESSSPRYQSQLAAVLESEPESPTRVAAVPGAVCSSPPVQTQPPGVPADSISIDDPGFNANVLKPELVSPIQIKQESQAKLSAKRKLRPDFTQEIDEDLLSGKRRTPFPRPPEPLKMLPTPVSMVADNRKLDSWLQRPDNVETPTRPKGKKSDDNHKQKGTRVQALATVEKDKNTPPTHLAKSLDDLIVADWHPSDFIVNPEFNENVDFAYRQTLRGASRKCEHGYDCQECSEFYKLAGTGIQPAGPQWSDASRTPASRTPLGERSANETIDKVSKHRGRWERPPSPPGFWRSEFPTTQETEDDRAAAKEMQTVEVQKRLQEAIKSGRWVFRDRRLRLRVQQLAE